MAITVSQLKAQFTSDTADLEQGVARAARASDKAAGDIRAAGARSEGAFDGLSAKAVALGSLMSSALQAGIGGLASAFGALQSSMIGGNAEFETYQTQFGVLLNSADAAKQRLQELADFGASTPFELPEVVRADKILQGFGLHAEDTAKRFGMAGTEIRTVAGDVAAGTGASFEEITGYLGKFSSGATGEAIARMQELGITTRAELASMGVAFDKGGSMTSPVEKGMTALLQIMEQKFGGMMAAQSATFDGMKSNLMDWVGTATRTLGAPIFDSLKGQLSDLLKVLGSSEVSSALTSLASSLGFAFSGLAPIISGAIANIGPALSGLATTVQNTVNTVATAIQALRAGFAAAGAGGAAFNLLTMLGMDDSTAANIGAILNNIVSTVRTGITAIQGAIAGFQSGGLAGGASAFLTGLGLDPSIAAQATSIINGITSAIQTGVNALQAAVAGFATGGVGGGASALLTSLGIDPSTAAQVGAVMGQITSAIQTGLGVAVAVIALAGQGFMTILPTLTTIATVIGGTVIGAFNALAGVVGFVSQNWQVFATVLGGVLGVVAVGLVAFAATATASFLATSAAALTAAVATAGAWLAALSPIVVVAGLIAAAIGMMAVAWQTNLGGIQEKTAAFVSTVQAQWNQLIGNLGALGAAFNQALTGDIGGALATFQSTVAQNNATYAGAMNEIASRTAETANSASSSMDTLASNTSTSGQLIQAAMSGNFGAIPGIVSGAMGAASNALGGAIGDMVANATNGANAIRGQLASISSMSQAIGGLNDPMNGPSLDQGLISGRTDPASIAQKNLEYAQKTTELANSYKAIQTSMGKVASGVAAAGGAATGAGTAAKSAEDKIREANSALQSTIQTVTDLNEMLKSGLSGLTVGEGADQIVQLASQVAQLGRRMFEVFSQAAAGLQEDAGKAAGVLSQGIGSAAQGLSSVIGLLPKLWEFMNSPEWGEMQGNMGAVIAMAAQLSSIGRQIYDVFSAAAAGVSEESAKAAQAAAAGIGAASQALTTIVGLLPKLWEFINDPAWDEIQAAQGQVIEAAAQLSQLGVAIFNAFSAASGGISEESSKAAQAAAAGIQAATGAISSIIDTVKKIVDFTADVGYAAMIFSDEGRGHIMAAASALISLGVEMFNQFAAAASGISAKAVASAKRLSEGLKSMGDGVSSVVDAVVKLSSFMSDGMNNIHVNNEESRGAIITMTGLLASLGKLMLDQFALAASQVSSLAVAAAKRLSEGLQAVTTGITSVIDAVAKMSSFMADGMNNVHMNSEQSRNALITMAHFLANVGREIYNQFVVVSVSVAQLHVDAAKRLSEGIKAASDAMTATMGLVTAMSSFMANTALAAMVAPGEARQALFNLAIHLSEVAREIYNQFVNSSVLVSQYHVDAAKRLAEGVQAATSALTATLDLVDRLMTATTSTAIAAAVAPGPLRDALFALVQNLSIFAREVYNQWVAASVLVSQYHVEAARRLADGAAAAMQAVGSAMDMLGSLFRFAGDKVMMAIVQSIGARQWFARLAAALGQFVEDVLEAFDTFGVGVAQDVVDNAARLGAGAEAASQIINASIGALASLFKFAGDAVMMSIIQSAGARTWFANLGAALGQFVEDVLEAFDTFDVGIAQNVVDRAERLGQGADAANQILTGAVGALTSLFKLASDAAMVAVVSSQSTRESYARLAAALGQFVEDALEAFNTFDVSVTQAMVDQAAQLGAGAAAIQSVVDGVLGIIEKLTDQNFPSLEGGAMTVILDRLEDVFGAGKQIADRATTITKEWTVTVMPVVATLGTVLGGTLDLVSRTLGLISELGGSNFPDLGAKAMSTILDRLERLLEAGKKIADKATTIAKSWGAEVNPVIATVGTVIGNGLDVVSKTLNIVGELGGNRFPDLGAKAMSTILDRLEQLLGAGKKIADRATTVAKEWTATVSPVMTTVGNVLSAGLDLVSRTLDIVGQLGGEKFPDLSDGAVGVILARLEDLLKAGKQIAEKALSVALNWTATVNPVMETVGKILDNGLGLVSTTLDIVGQLTGDKFPDLSDGAIAIILIRLEDLLKAGKRIADRALLVATGWTATVNPVMETVGKILSDGLDIVAKTLDIVGQLAGDKFPALDDEAMSIILTRLEDLLKAGKQIAERALAVATGWTSLVNPVMATVGKVLADGLDIVSKTLDIVGQLGGEKFPALDSAAMGIILTRLEAVLGAGKLIADRALAVATGWQSAVNPAMAVVGKILSDSLDIIGKTLDLQGLLGGTKFPAFDAATLDLMLGRLATVLAAGKLLADEAIRVATGWQATVNPAMAVVGKILGDGLAIIQDVLEFNGLKSALLNFRGLDMSIIGPKIDLIFAAAIAIAEAFGRKAEQSNVTQAFVDAAEKVSKVLDGAFGALNGALDLGKRLLDPETQIPSVGQVQGKLNAAFAFIQSVTTQFAAAASSMASSGVDFDQVKSMADSAKAAFDVIMSAVETISTLREKHVGMDDLQEIRAFLAQVFGVFNEFGGSAVNVEAVVSAVSSVLGGLANMVDAQAYQAGVDIGTRIADGIAAGLSSAVGVIGSALMAAATSDGGGRGLGTPGVAPGGGGGGGNVTYIYNTDNSKNITVSQVINTTPDNVGKAAGGMYPLLAGY